MPNPSPTTRLTGDRRAGLRRPNRTSGPNPAITSKERDIPDKKKPAPSLAAPLHMTVFNPGKEAIFPITSTIVYGLHEAMLVDAHFQKRYADKLVQLNKGHGSKPEVHLHLAQRPRLLFRARRDQEGLSGSPRDLDGADRPSEVATGYMQNYAR